jgi:uncharacterized repeat protein (TIGR01451 family)
MTYQGKRAVWPSHWAAFGSTLFGSAILTFAAAPAHAAGTIAGTSIDNTATATYDLPGGGTSTVTSNTLKLRVDELLDVAVASTDGGDVASFPGGTNQVLKFKVTNSGNGSEAFKLTTTDAVGGDDFDPSVTSIVLDTNNNGVYDAGVDTVYVSGSNDPVLAPDASITAFVLSTIPAGAANAQRGQAKLKATSATGSGTPGTTFAGAGQGGGDAVVGATTAAAEAGGFYAIAAANLGFTKSAVVTDQFGGTTQVPGATITYTLAATASGSGSVANVKISDPIPSGTTFKPGSIKLDGTGLTDASDADAGNFSGTAINVTVGNMAAGSSHNVTFQVKIN